MNITRRLNSTLPYLFGEEVDYFANLELEDGAFIVFLGYGPGLMALALYESAGWDKYNSFAVDTTNFTGLEHITLLPFTVNSIIPMRMTTDQASEVLMGEYDAIFVDANHSYESVKRDIQNWASKVRSNGILFFHDYIPQESDAPDNGVKQAVNEWDKEGFELESQIGSAIIFRRTH